MEENFLLAKQTVLKKYSENHPYYAFFVCALYGLLQNHKDKQVVIDAFLKTQILIEPGTISDILKRNDVDYSEDDSETLGISRTPVSLSPTSSPCNQTDLPLIACSTTLTPGYERLLFSFCHEMNHIIDAMSGKREVVIESNSVYKIIVKD